MEKKVTIEMTEAQTIALLNALIERAGKLEEENSNIRQSNAALCRAHHQEAHQHGDARLMEKYHLEPLVIDGRIAKIYKLRAEGTK